MTDEGGFDIGALLAQAQQMQEQMQQAQDEQAQVEVTGTSGGGKVAITMTGAGAFVGVSIAPDVVDPDDIEMLEDLILAALRDAGSKVIELQVESMEDVGLPDIGGLLGGA